MLQKNLLSLFIILFFCFGACAQKYWTGSAGDGLWNSPTNWNPAGVPGNSDDVVLDNLNGTSVSYNVTLPNTSVTINTIRITPNSNNIIYLILPPTNLNHPALNFNGNGNVLVIDKNGVFKNSSDSPSSSPDVISIGITDTIRLNNGCNYIHNNSRSLPYLVDKL